jgi:geranylgeranyl pyrophosphate synthase
VIAEIAIEFLKRGGKRLRPRLCMAAYRSVAGDAVPAGSLEDLCEAVECFHKASLIHDDIQDGDEERYGRPTVWKEHGLPLAIAAGDWLVAHGYRLILNSGFPNALEMMKSTAESHVALCEGQGDDLAGVGDYRSVCERKTGEAFALAAELGALAAGVDANPYRAYGMAFGLLFQVRDDLADGDELSKANAVRDEAEKSFAEAESRIGLGEWYKQ